MFGPKMRFGSFIAPFHTLKENPTVALERDLELVQHMDQLGYDEAWFGEHHSGGFEVIASPELFIATVAERTKHIRLGTGVSSLPYHHPLMLADRINQLDHITRGRTMFGVGPGALPSDAHMMGIPVAKQRDRMDEALDCIVRLLRGETVNYTCEWFELHEARLQLSPYTRPSIEMAVASMVSPTGANAMGRHGLGMLSIGATNAGGFNALASNWKIAEQSARDSGKTVDRSAWRLVGPMHIAETREQARADVAYGIRDWLYYFSDVAALPMAVDPDADPVDALIATGMAVIGTPDDAIAQIERLEKQTGGFGCYLLLDHNWADWDRKKRSYELMARYVFPKFQASNVNREESLAWARDNRPAFIGEMNTAVGARVQRHVETKGGDNISPEVIEALGLGKKPGAAA